MNDQHAFANELLIEKLALVSSAPYQPHSATSTSAAKAIEPVAGTQRALIVERIRDAQSLGMTDGEIQYECEMAGDTVRPRRGELQKDGLIVDSGRTRKTASGRDAVVWVAVEYSAAKE